MKKSALFLMASIRSHVIPALYLAELMANEYEIYFATSSEVLSEIVIKHGYNVARTSSFRVCLGMEERFLFETTGKTNRWATLKCIRNNDVLKYRQNELSLIVDQISPVAILIDIFNSTDMFVIYANYRKAKFLFLNPMLSTYRVNGFPTVDQGHWPEYPTISATTVKRKTSFKRLVSSPFAALLSRAMRNQFKKLTEMGGFSERHPVSNNLTNALLFDHIPEIILAPLELEFSPDVCKAQQHYLGLCVATNRQDTELDPSFDERFEHIIMRKKNGKRLIYCTFGTYYQGSDRALLDFLNKLLDAVEGLQDVEVILSVNAVVIETMIYLRKIPPYVHMFSRVPQLSVLKHSEVFVTHGGLGSIKESISYGVPMLVYPLDLRYDQNGNGLKVEHHGLGLRGVFESERSVDMKGKIQELLDNPSFVCRIRDFQNRIRSNQIYSDKAEQLRHLVESLPSGIPYKSFNLPDRPSYNIDIKKQ